MDSRQLLGIHKQMGSKKLKSFPILNFFDFHVNHRFLRGMKVLSPLNFIEYNKSDAIRILTSDFGWTNYGGKHYESRWTKFFQAYYLPHRFGYDKRKAHLSSLIASKQITRDEAVQKLSEPLYEEVDLKSDKIFVAKKLKISVTELEDLIALPLRSFSDYPNYQLQRKLAKRSFSVYKKFANLWKR